LYHTDSAAIFATVYFRVKIFPMFCHKNKTNKIDKTCNLKTIKQAAFLSAAVSFIH